MTKASALFILEEKSACLIASPASFVGRGSFAMSMRSVSTPLCLLSSSVTRRAACRLMRPILAVPRITGMKSLRLVSIDLSRRLGSLLDHTALQLDDLAALPQRQPMLLPRFELLRNINLNLSRHGHPLAYLSPITLLYG